MAGAVSQEKRPDEKIRLGADFSSVLLTGETIQSGNIVVSVADAKTDATAPSILLAGASLTGNTVTQAVQGGATGDVYVVTFSTGLTNLGLTYSTSITLVITSQPASDNILCTRDEVKRKLRVTDNSEDALIDDLLVAASEYIRRRCGRDFSFQRYVEITRPEEDPCRLRLSNWPIVTVEKITLRYANGASAIDYTDPTTFAWDPEGYIWFTPALSAEFYTFPDENEITYRAGYPKIPEDLREACKDVTIWMYRAIGREGLSSERIGEYAYSRRSLGDFAPGRLFELPVEFVESVIQRYARRELALL